MLSSPAQNVRAHTTTASASPAVGVTATTESGGVLLDETRSNFGADRTTVTVRIRPAVGDELGTSECLFPVGSAGVTLRVPVMSKKAKTATATTTTTYFVDEVVDTAGTQHELFRTTVEPLVDGVLQGFNAAVLCHGEHGSGKTYSLVGGTSSSNPAEHGMILRSVQHVLTAVKEGHVVSGHRVCAWYSYVEMDSEGLTDLTATAATTTRGADQVSSATSAGPNRSLELCEDKQNGVYVKNQVVTPLSRLDDVASILGVVANRKDKDNYRNAHRIFTMYIEMMPEQQELPKVRSKMTFVELGDASAWASSTPLTVSNQGLAALTECVNALQDAHRLHVPYRNSKLTRLLQDALGGNARTAWIVCVSPSLQRAAQTGAMLQLGVRARRVVSYARVMEIGAGAQQRHVDRLEAEVQQLRGYLRECADLPALRARVRILEKEKGEMTISNNYNNNNNSSSTSSRSTMIDPALVPMALLPATAIEGMLLGKAKLLQLAMERLSDAERRIVQYHRWAVSVVVPSTFSDVADDDGEKKGRSDDRLRLLEDTVSILEHRLEDAQHLYHRDIGALRNELAECQAKLEVFRRQEAAVGLDLAKQNRKRQQQQEHALLNHRQAANRTGGPTDDGNTDAQMLAETTEDFAAEMWHHVAEHVSSQTSFAGMSFSTERREADLRLLHDRVLARAFAFCQGVRHQVRRAASEYDTWVSLPQRALKEYHEQLSFEKVMVGFRRGQIEVVLQRLSHAVESVASVLREVEAETGKAIHGTTDMIQEELSGSSSMPQQHEDIVKLAHDLGVHLPPPPRESSDIVSVPVTPTLAAVLRGKTRGWRKVVDGVQAFTTSMLDQIRRLTVPTADTHKKGEGGESQLREEELQRASDAYECAVASISQFLHDHDEQGQRGQFDAAVFRALKTADTVLVDPVLREAANVEPRFKATSFLKPTGGGSGIESLLLSNLLGGVGGNNVKGRGSSPQLRRPRAVASPTRPSTPSQPKRSTPETKLQPPLPATTSSPQRPGYVRKHRASPGRVPLPNTVPGMFSEQLMRGRDVVATSSPSRLSPPVRVASVERLNQLSTPRTRATPTRNNNNNNNNSSSSSSAKKHYWK
eukprot:PhM_4_TR10089/c0_g1_i1/m.75722